MNDSVFCVYNLPYCLKDIDIKEKNIDFLNGIDTDYYEFILNTFASSEDSKRASIVLRSTLHHAIETMFSLMGAFIQAPDCCYAWMPKCSNVELKNIVHDIANEGLVIIPKINILQKSISFKKISECIHNSSVFPQRENDNTVKLFAKFWSRLACDYLDKNNIDEYNSIKHGFRIKSGGFTLRAGIQKEKGVSPLEKDINTIGHSKYGTTFFKIEKTSNEKGNRSIISKRTSLNWRYEKTILLLQLVAFSINNITSALKILNGVKSSDCIFERPSKDEDFLNPWSYATGVTNFTMDVHIPKANLKDTTKDELLNIIQRSFESKKDNGKI